MPNKKVNFSVDFDPEDHARLSEIAHILRISKGAVVRQLISHAFKVYIDGAPTCADGVPCLVPHLKIPQPAAPTKVAP